MAEEEAAQDVAPASGAAEPEEGAAETVSDLGPPPEVLDYYISYRETDSNGYSDKDVASRLAGALQRASGVNGVPRRARVDAQQSGEKRPRDGKDAVEKSQATDRRSTCRSTR